MQFALIIPKCYNGRAYQGSNSIDTISGFYLLDYHFRFLIIY